MSGYLQRLLARSHEPAGALRPRARSPFEPAPALDAPLEVVTDAPWKPAPGTSPPQDASRPPPTTRRAEPDSTSTERETPHRDAPAAPPPTPRSPRRPASDDLEILTPTPAASPTTPLADASSRARPETAASLRGTDAVGRPASVPELPPAPPRPTGPPLRPIAAGTDPEGRDTLTSGDRAAPPPPRPSRRLTSARPVDAVAPASTPLRSSRDALALGPHEAERADRETPTRAELHARQREAVADVPATPPSGPSPSSEPPTETGPDASRGTGRTEDRDAEPAPALSPRRPIEARPLPPSTPVSFGELEPRSEPDPTIHVSIGVVEVRAVAPPPAPRRRAERPAPVVSLDAFLKPNGTR